MVDEEKYFQQNVHYRCLKCGTRSPITAKYCRNYSCKALLTTFGTVVEPTPPEPAPGPTPEPKPDPQIQENFDRIAREREYLRRYKTEYEERKRVTKDQHAWEENYIHWQGKRLDFEESYWRNYANGKFIEPDPEAYQNMHRSAEDWRKLEEAECKEKEEAERKAREEAERQAQRKKEQEEEERRRQAQEEARRQQAQKEAARQAELKKEAERQARLKKEQEEEERRRQAREEAERQARLKKEAERQARLKKEQEEQARQQAQKEAARQAQFKRDQEKRRQQDEAVRKQKEAQWRARAKEENKKRKKAERRKYYLFAAEVAAAVLFFMALAGGYSEQITVTFLILVIISIALVIRPFSEKHKDRAAWKQAGLNKKPADDFYQFGYYFTVRKADFFAVADRLLQQQEPLRMHGRIDMDEREPNCLVFTNAGCWTAKLQLVLHDDEPNRDIYHFWFSFIKKNGSVPEDYKGMCARFTQVQNLLIAMDSGTIIQKQSIRLS